eukprot:TRINITY_DN1160_c0_g1_i1.p1 TRINITY_DN1160_c0_g1~~TRINITY_DN1160_c0_g1_i1.p1  ORF type:complete len:173 (+),score=19.04 TRINITY_DN1160_c0_g1_i1:48-566(+)
MADRTRTQPPHAMTASSAFPPLRGCSPVISEYTGEGTRPSRLPNHARRSPTKMLSHSQDSNAQHHSVPVTQISQRRPHPDLCDDSTRISPSNRRLYPDSFNRTTFHEDFAQSPGRRLFQYLPPPHNPDAPKRTLKHIPPPPVSPPRQTRRKYLDPGEQAFLFYLQSLQQTFD